jgi:hypothetical protein
LGATYIDVHKIANKQLKSVFEIIVAGTVLNYFEPFLGRIEIKTADKVERVYFEIDENNIEQWEKPQIRESKKAFFYATITGLHIPLLQSVSPI